MAKREYNETKSYSLYPRQIEMVAELAEQTGLTPSAVIRMAIEAYHKSTMRKAAKAASLEPTVTNPDEEAEWARVRKDQVQS